MTADSTDFISGFPVDLRQRRDAWQAAYLNKDIAMLSAIETSEFFVVYYQNVEKKPDWHKNVLMIQDENDPLLVMNEAKKVRLDNINSNTCIITSFFKSATQSCLIKEMWVKQTENWQLASLALSKT